MDKQQLRPNGSVDAENHHECSSSDMCCIGLDVHEKAISYCVKDANGQVNREGKIEATRNELDLWTKMLPQLLDA